MSKSSGLKVEYIEPIWEDEQADDKRLVKFVTLFSQVGFKEICLNPDTNIKIDYCE